MKIVLSGFIDDVDSFTKYMSAYKCHDDYNNTIFYLIDKGFHYAENSAA